MYMYMYMYIYIHIYVYINKQIYICIYMYIYVYICIYLSIDLYIYIELLSPYMIDMLEISQLLFGKSVCASPQPVNWADWANWAYHMGSHGCNVQEYSKSFSGWWLQHLHTFQVEIHQLEWRSQKQHFFSHQPGNIEGATGYFRDIAPNSCQARETNDPSVGHFLFHFGIFW